MDSEAWVLHHSFALTVNLTIVRTHMFAFCNQLTSSQPARGILIAGLGLGLVGTVLMFFGLECTYIGGDQRCKDSLLVTASVIHLLSGDGFFLVFFRIYENSFLEHLPAGSSCFLYGPSFFPLSRMQVCQTW